MGYYSELDIAIREATGQSPTDIETQLPRCPICRGLQTILTYQGRMIQVFCTDDNCIGFDNPHWITEKGEG